MLLETTSTLRGADKVKYAVQQWIKEHQPRHDEKLPSQNQLAKFLKVSPMTANKALRELSQAGVLHRIKGRGSFVGSSTKQRQGLRLALVLPGAHAELPENNPNSWHIVQRMINAVLQTLKTSDSFLTVVVDPNNYNQDDIIRLNNYDAVFFSGQAEFHKLIIELINNNTTVVINASNDDHKNEFECIRLIRPTQQDVMLGVSYLIERGYSKIAYIGSGKIYNQSKLHGYRQALEDYEIEYCEQRVVLNIDDQKSGKKGAIILENRQIEYDAIFVDTDLKAVGVIEYLNSIGKKSPDDIGIMGYDGLEQCIGAPLYLTSIQPTTQLMTAKSIEFIRQNQQQKVSLNKLIPTINGTIIANRTTK